MPWELTGNATEPNDFLGTTNNQPLEIRTNNTERMRVDTNGNVGIGTTNASTKLHVLGTPGFAAVVTTFEQPPGAMNFVDLRSSQGGGNYGSDIRFFDSGVLNAEIKSTANSQLRFATGPSSTDRVTIDSGGNVGIGTPNPAGPLHILGPAGAPPAAPPALQNGLLLGVQSTTSYKWMQSYGGALALNPIGNNVGIGTSQPLANLDIQSNNNVCLACNNSGDFTTGVFTNFTPNNQPTLLAINLGGGLALETVSSDNGWAARFDASTALANGVLVTAPQGRPGLLVASGTKSAAVATSQGACTLYTEESAEVWFTDYGFGHLQEGRTVIRIDPLFSETVNLNEPYHVFIQAYGKATLYVNQRTPSTFEVCLTEGDPNVEFSYRLVAKRRDYERARLERAPSADNDPNLYPEKRPEWEARYRVYRPTQAATTS